MRECLLQAHDGVVAVAMVQEGVVVPVDRGVEDGREGFQGGDGVLEAGYEIADCGVDLGDPAGGDGYGEGGHCGEGEGFFEIGQLRTGLGKIGVDILSRRAGEQFFI